MSNIRDQYKRELNNWLFAVSQTIAGIQHDQKATIDEKLKALDLIHMQLVKAKRAMIFLKNTQAPRDL
jgi:hypothetical protein